MRTQSMPCRVGKGSSFDIPQGVRGGGCLGILRADPEYLSACPSTKSRKNNCRRAGAGHAQPRAGLPTGANVRRFTRGGCLGHCSFSKGSLAGAMPCPCRAIGAKGANQAELLREPCLLLRKPNCAQSNGVCKQFLPRSPSAGGGSSGLGCFRWNTKYRPVASYTRYAAYPCSLSVRAETLSSDGPPSRLAPRVALGACSALPPRGPRADLWLRP